MLAGAALGQVGPARFFGVETARRRLYNLDFCAESFPQEISVMSYRCEICGKEPSFGNAIIRRGMAKKKGGVGQKITGISRRFFKPNIQRVRINDHGTVRRARVCAKCLKGGKVTKAV